MRNKEMKIEFCNFTYDERENCIIVLDAEEKVLAIFPIENRRYDFVRHYVSLMFRFFDTNAFVQADTLNEHKHAYRKMIGYKRYIRLLGKIDKAVKHK